VNILIVEDNQGIRDSLESSLVDSGFVVDTASDGKLGSEKARTKHYDLIILDNVLPVKDGREICSEVRSRGCNTPIIMLSVKADIDTKVDLLNTGVDDYLAKPFSFAELLARIRALLRRPAVTEHRLIKIGDLVIDSLSHTARRADKEAILTQKEFALLEYLARNRGVVLSRAEILEHVWDMNADSFTNTVEAHILKLRRKFGYENKNEFIHTIFGIGYKID
jgi:DNA-binding response OmpR family regulator